MSFDVTGDAYARFMGRYSEPLAVSFADTLELRPGQRALDVGCGPGALTAVLTERLGADSVSAVDPSESFVSAARDRLPHVDVRRASAEELPFAGNTFDVVTAQLVVHFLADPVAALTELARVTRSGGLVAACVWDFAGRGGPLAPFWRSVNEIDPSATDESQLPGAREGNLAELFAEAGLRRIESLTLTVRSEFATFDEWWQPFTLGVGPAGAYVARLTEAQRTDLRAECASHFPGRPFEVTATAWTALGRV